MNSRIMNHDSGERDEDDRAGEGPAQTQRNSDLDPPVGEARHPVAAGVGAVLLGGAAGAAVGTAAGPIGTAIGAAVGAIGGALGGDAVASSVDQVKEESHWRDNFAQRPYVGHSASYNDYGPAYRYGVVSYARYSGRRFEDVEADLSAGWEKARGESSLTWKDARHATQDAWDRVHRSSGSLSNERR